MCPPIVINEATNSFLFLIQCWILPHAEYWCDCKFPPETDTIRNKYDLKELSIRGNITNIYNSVYASYQFGDNKITSASIIINNSVS